MIICIILAVLFLHSFAEATTYWASPSGGAASCAAASGTSDPGQYRTFVQGIQCLSGGDTLKLIAGTYTLTNVPSTTIPPSGPSSASPTIIETATSGMVVLNWTAPQFTLFGNGTYLYGFKFDGRSNITLRGTSTSRNLAMRGSGHPAECQSPSVICYGAGGFGITIGGISNNIVVENVEFAYWNQGILGGGSSVTNHRYTNLEIHNIGKNPNGTRHCDVGGGYGQSDSHCHPFYTGFGSQGAVIEDGILRDSAGYGIECVFGDGGDCRNTTIRRNKIYNNAAMGMLIQGGIPGGAARIYNNLIYNNAGGKGILLDGGATNGLIANNTIYNHNSVGICVSGGSGPVSLQNNLLVGNPDGINITNCHNQGAAGGVTAAANISTGTAASHFADAANGDFRLSATSLAIGAAVQLNSLFTTDIVGATRGSVWDVGAYESTSVLAPTVVVNSPTISGTYSAVTSPIVISGTFQSGALLTSVTWSNSLGGSGTATGTANWTIPAAVLTPGVNVITITGTDANKLTGQATLTVTYAPGALVGAWSCDEGSGSTVADASGNSNNGTFTSSGWNATGKFGAACSFNGSTSIVTVADANSLDLFGGATLQAWVNPSVQTSAWRSLFSKGANYYLYSSSSDRCGTSNLYGGFINGSTYNTTCYSVPLPINTWTFVTLRMDGSSVNIYTGTTLADFTLRSSLSTTQAMITNSDSLAIGNGDGAFAGLLDNMRIYNYARSAIAGSGTCGFSYSELQCDMITAINPTAPMILQLGTGTVALQLGPGVTLELGAQ
jgi:hypothetical protein